MKPEMNQNRYDYESAKIAVAGKEADVREAKLKMDSIFARGEAQVAEARAEADVKNAEAKNAFELANLDLQRQRKWLELCETKLEKGYET